MISLILENYPIAPIAGYNQTTLNSAPLQQPQEKKDNQQPQINNQILTTNNELLPQNQVMLNPYQNMYPYFIPQQLPNNITQNNNVSGQQQKTQQQPKVKEPTISELVNKIIETKKKDFKKKSDNAKKFVKPFMYGAGATLGAQAAYDVYNFFNNKNWNSPFNGEKL